MERGEKKREKKGQDAAAVMQGDPVDKIFIQTKYERNPEGP